MQLHAAQGKFTFPEYNQGCLRSLIVFRKHVKALSLCALPSKDVPQLGGNFFLPLTRAAPLITPGEHKTGSMSEPPRQLLPETPNTPCLGAWNHGRRLGPLLMPIKSLAVQHSSGHISKNAAHAQLQARRVSYTVLQGPKTSAQTGAGAAVSVTHCMHC